MKKNFIGLSLVGLLFFAACGGGGGSSPSSSSGSTPSSSGGSSSKAVYLKCDCSEVTGNGDIWSFTNPTDKFIFSGSNPTSVIHQTPGGVNETVSTPDCRSGSSSINATGGISIIYCASMHTSGDRTYTINYTDGVKYYQIYALSNGAPWSADRVFYSVDGQDAAIDMQSKAIVFYSNNYQVGGSNPLAIWQMANAPSANTVAFNSVIRTGENSFVIVATGTVNSSSDIYP
jgi:hypothetical protein